MRKIFVLLWTLSLFSLLFIGVFLRWEGLHPVSVTSKYVSTLVEAPACVVPHLDPMGPSVAKFIHPEPPLDCGNGSEPLIHSNLTTLWVSNSSLTCCYQKLEFKRKDTFRYTGDCVKFPPSGVSPSPDVEFVRISCNSSSEDFAISSPVRDFHAFVPYKQNIERHTKASSKSGISVLMLGLDSVSRLNFHRQMPLTLQLLRRLGAVEMLGYNKVADNTFPNLVPVLAGLSESELKKVCWPSKSSTFDTCPFIWKDFAKAGYRTLFLEDIPYLGMFNFEKSGFKDPPTDYYLRPFMKALDDEIGHNGLETSNRCAGTRLQVEILMSYVEKFVTTFAKDFYWGLVWSTSLSHDDLNAPQIMDSVMRDALEGMYNKSLLNDTVLILFSDHGSRLGKVRETYQGRLEERLPYLFFIFPEWFKQRHSSAIEVMEINKSRLTSPYDLHETLLDLLNLPTLGSRDTGTRGLSLLGSNPIPLERMCEEAGISEHWCTCYETSLANATSTEAEEVARTVVDFINKLLESYPQCAELRLARVGELRVWHHPMKTRHSSRSVQDYLVTVETSPGGGLFEATVINHNNTLQAKSGEISRINRYGNQSACIHDFHMKLFCYCMNQENSS